MSVRLLRASLRNYRRILLLSVGVILSVSLIAGINIGIETISRSVLQSYVQQVSYDMTVDQSSYNSTYVDFSSQLSSVQDVVHVEKILQWNPSFSSFYARNLSSASANIDNAQFAVVGLDPSFESRYNVTLTQGTWDLSGGVVIPTALASALKVRPGETMNITLGYENSTRTGISYWVWSVKVSGIATFSTLAQNVIFGTRGQYGGTPIVGGGIAFQTGFSIQTTFPIALTYGALQTGFQSFVNKAFQGQPGNPSYLQIAYRIFLNRADVLNLFDADGTLARLSVIENQIYFKISSSSGVPPYVQSYPYVEDSLANAISSYRGWLQGALLSFYLFSLPVLPITWYLAMTSWYMVTSRKRREFGLFKARGISGKTIFRTAMMEAAIVGVVGSLLGLLAGYLVGAAVASFLGTQPLFAFSISALTPEIVGIGLFLGVFISVLAAFRPARMAARLPPTEAVKEYVGEEVEVGKPWRPTWTWLAVILGTYKMLEWIFNFSPFSVFPSGPPSSNFFFFILILAWGILSGILIPFAPFLFVYGVTKLVTRSQNKLYRSTLLVLRTFMRDMANVTARALSRNPARVSRVAFLIALTLTFGIFVNVFMASQQDLQVRSTQLQLGADINVHSYAPSINETFVSNLTSINGISKVTYIHAEGASSPYSGVSGVTVYGIDASTFLDAVYRGEQITVGASEPLFQQMQQTPNAALVSTGLADFLKLGIGDAFELTPNGDNATSPILLKVVGFYKLLPGVSTTYYPPSPGPGGLIQTYYGGSLVTNLAYLRKVGFVNSMDFAFLVKLTSSGGAAQVANTIRSIYGSKLTSVETVSERMAALNGSAPVAAISSFLELTSGYLFLAAVLGFAIISWANTQERLGEIAIFRSRGAGRLQALRILFAESFAVLVIAVAIGVAAGLVSAYGLLRFFTVGTVSSTYYGLDLRLVAPAELWILLAASIGGLLVSILIPAWLSLRKTVIQTVRFR